MFLESLSSWDNPTLNSRGIIGECDNILRAVLVVVYTVNSVGVGVGARV